MVSKLLEKNTIILKIVTSAKSDQDNAHEKNSKNYLFSQITLKQLFE